MLVFGYQLALDNGRADLRWSPTLDTETAILLLETNSLNPDISGLKPLGADSFGSTDVTRWEANKITTGTSFEIRVVDTSEASIIRTLRGTTTDRWAIAISVPTLIFALGLVVWRRTWRHPPDPDPIDAAYILLEEIRASQAVSDNDPNATQTSRSYYFTPRHSYVVFVEHNENSREMACHSISERRPILMLIGNDSNGIQPRNCFRINLSIAELFGHT